MSVEVVVDVGREVGDSRLGGQSGHPQQGIVRAPVFDFHADFDAVGNLGSGFEALPR